MSNIEQTLSIIKPDAVERNLVDDIKNIFKKLDSGDTIIQKSFFLDVKDDEKILKKKTQKLEHLAFPEAIIKIFRNSSF
jgi:nucleoside diphosphate kinase